MFDRSNRTLRIYFYNITALFVLRSTCVFLSNNDISKLSFLNKIQIDQNNHYTLEKMEKNHRLFLRNLPHDIVNDDLEKIFEEYGTLTNIDIKEKIQNDGSRIAFVNISTTEINLNRCFRAANGALLRNNAIRIEVAKESFLDRLKREREEASNVKTPIKQVVTQDQPIERINIKVPTAVKSKPTKRIYNFDDIDSTVTTNNHDEKINNDFTYDPALQAETIPIKKPLKIDSPMPEKSYEKIEKIPEKKVISESETKRLASLKQKRLMFGANKKILSHAFKAVDSTSKNNKVVFSDDMDEIAGFRGKKSKSLFDDEENLEDQEDWNEDNFKHDEKRNAKLKMSLKNLGHDKRFEIDERFLDDDDKSMIKIGDDETASDAKNETKWQLDILENILGKPFKARDEKLGVKKQKKMVRYDPTSIGHRDHELEMQKPVIRAKRVKSTNTIEQEETPIPVSSEVFYTVSENLNEALKPQEEFSLLKSFGTATTNDKNRIDEYEATANAAQEQKWERSYDAKNPFKYESSDDETPYPSMDQLTCKNDVSTKSKIKEANDTFFFANNDGRFHEAEEFFNTIPTTTDNFANVRRELKQIVRSKIRNNVKKNTPWRNTKIATQPKIR